jgi:hypothetical protein
VGESQAAGETYPEVPVFCVRKGAMDKATGGRNGSEKFSFDFKWRERPRGQKAQESKRFRPELNLWGARRDTAFKVG